MANFFKNEQSIGVTQTLPELVQNTEKNYQAAIKYYEAREQIFRAQALKQSGLEASKINLDKMKIVLQNVSNKLKDFEKGWLQIARVIAGDDGQNAASTITKFLNDPKKGITRSDINKFKGYSIKFGPKNKSSHINAQLLQSITSFTDVATVHEQLSAQLIFEEFQNVFKKGLEDSLSGTASSALNFLAQQIGKVAASNAGIRSAGKQTGTDVLFGFNITINGNSITQNNTTINLPDVIELQTGIDLSVPKNLQNLKNQVQGKLFKQGYQLFDSLYGSQQKSWKYENANNKTWMHSGVMQQHLQNIFNQTQREHTWVDEYAMNYVGWSLSRYLLNIVGALNIFLVTGNKITYMSDFLKYHTFYMPLKTKQVWETIRTDERKKGVSNLTSAHETKIDVANSAITIRKTPPNDRQLYINRRLIYSDIGKFIVEQGLATEEDISGKTGKANINNIMKQHKDIKFPISYELATVLKRNQKI